MACNRTTSYGATWPVVVFLALFVIIMLPHAPVVIDAAEMGRDRARYSSFAEQDSEEAK
jgi:hypothetical protein